MNLYGKVVHLQQISKPVAKRLYEAGKRIWLHPCKMSLSNPWQSPCDIQKPNQFPVSFDCMVNDYRYHNCCSQRGTYPHYFQEI